ncbi:MAG: Hsp33 family molecular chaperone HslO [Deltaproteobacteria bacterium]
MNDSSLRAMTDDSAFRVMAVNTTQTVREALSRQAPSGMTRKTFADLLTGAVLVRETMSPNERVQAILKRRKETGSLLADTHPTEGTRGLVSLPANSLQFPLTDAVLQVMRRLHGGNTHQGVVDVPTGGDVSDALREYMRVSEQVDTLVAVGTLFDGEEVAHAGGYLIQLLPGVGTAPLAFMTERVREFGNIDAHLASGKAEPRALIAALLEQIPYTELSDSELKFGCWCSAERLLGALSTLPKADIDDFVQRGEVLEISCDYCHRQYRIPPAKLVGLQLES